MPKDLWINAFVGAAFVSRGRFLNVTTQIDTLDTDRHIGLELRIKREAMGWSLSDVAGKLNINSTYLAAIESLNTEALPNAGYGAGFVRSYASLLGMNSKDAITQYKAETEPTPEPSRFSAPHFAARREIQLPRGSFAAAMIAVTFTSLAVWYGTSTTAQSPELYTDKSETPVTAAPAPKITLDPALITVEAISTSWIEVRDAQNGLVASKILIAGQNFELPRSEGMMLAARDGGAIKIHRAGNVSGPLGPKGVPLVAYPLP